MHEWQPIETAPKDGAPFQAWAKVIGLNTPGFWEPTVRINAESGATEVFWRVGYDEDGWECHRGLTFTHWMPHPTPPVSA